MDNSGVSRALSVADARSSSDGVAIRHAPPVFWMTLYLHTTATLSSVFHCDIAEIRFAGKLVIIDILINQRIECCVNNTVKYSLLNSAHYAMLGLGDAIKA